MKHVVLFIAYFILSISIPDYIFAFDNSSDSLHQELKKASDTSEINILVELAELNMFKYPDSTIYYGTKALENSEKLGFVSGKAKSYMKIADGHYFKNDFNSSINYLSKAADVFEESNDLSRYAECLNRIGVNYNRIGNYAQAKAYSLRALKIFQEENNFDGQWKCVSNLGIVAKELGDLNQSLEYHFKSIEIAEKLADPGIKNRVLTNIGNTYFALDEIDQSLSYFKAAMKLADSLYIKKSMAMLRNNIATCYEVMEDYDKAEEYYKASLTLKRELGDFLGAAVTLNNLGFNYIDKKNYAAALSSFQEALGQRDITDITQSNCYIGLTKISLIKGDLEKAEAYALKSQKLMSDIDNMPQRKNITETLYEVYESEGEYKKALYYLKLMHAYSDSLVNREKLVEMGRLEARHEFDMKEQQMIADQLNHDLENERILSGHRQVTWLSIAAFLITLLVSVFIYMSHREKHKANQLLKDKNDEISRQKEKIEVQADKLSELNVLKDRLFSIISHDLRNPLTSVKLLLDMAIKQDFSEEDFKKFLPIASKDVDYTLGLLNNLLHWSNSQLKGEHIHQENFGLDGIIQNVIRIYEREAIRKKITIENIIDQGLTVYADRNMVELVLRNLISNAVKFCEEDDTIKISASVHDQMTEICVEDTGVGISPEYIDKLFKNDNITTRGTNNEKGTGLGLILCKEFVEKNGGKIQVESTHGVGTKFCFTLPVAEGVENDEVLL